MNDCRCTVTQGLIKNYNFGNVPNSRQKSTNLNQNNKIHLILRLSKYVTICWRTQVWGTWTVEWINIQMILNHCLSSMESVFINGITSYSKGTVSQDFFLYLSCSKDSSWAPNEQAKTVSKRYSITKFENWVSAYCNCQRSQRLRGHTFFSNIFAKTKNFAKPFWPVHIGPRQIFFK